MKTLICLSLALGVVASVAQVPPPPAANQAEVTTGTARSKYVSPYTLSIRLAAFSGPTNGVTATAVSNTVSATFGGSIYSNGRVGINKASPTYNLDVLLGGYQMLRLISTNDDSLITLGSNVTGSTNWTFGATSMTSGQPTNSFVLETTDSGAGNTAVRVLVQGSTGNMGIGTSTPRSKLDVNGTINATAFVGAIGGTNLTGGTVNSNSFDAGTLAALQAVGGGGVTLGQVTNVFYGLITNAVTGMVQASTNVVIWETIVITNAAGLRQVITSTNFQGTLLGNVEAPTNAFSGTVFYLGTNSFLSTGSALTFTGTGNIPNNTERWGQLTILATASIGITNPAAWFTSDMASGRILTNGQTLVVAVDVQPGVFTNAAIVQFKHQ